MAPQGASPETGVPGWRPPFQIDQRITVAIVYVSAMFMSIMDSTVVNVALATLSREFNVPTGSIDAVVVGYLVSLAVFIPASGWLGDRFGTKRVFLFALGLFTLASALCGLAGSFNQLVLFRIMQGAGGGMLTPVGLAMLWRTFPPEERVNISRILMIPTVIAPASGPILGGFLIEHFSWQWAFYVNVPIGLAMLLFGLVFLQEHREPTAGRFDLAGFGLSAIGFPLVMFALSDGPSRGWGSGVIVASIIIGVVALAAFVVVELRTPMPMVQLRLLGNRLFRTTNLVSMCSGAGFIGLLFLAPLFLQEARGDSPLASGLNTFPEAIGILVSTQFVARIYPRIGPRRLMVGGLLGVTALMATFCLVGPESSDWVIRLLMFLIGGGMAFVFLPNQAAAFATISSADTGQASTLSNMQRQLGNAMGVAILSTVLVAVGPVRQLASGETVPNAGAYQAAFLAAAGLALLGAILALKVPDRDAANTMRIGARREKRRHTAHKPAVAHDD